MKFDIWNHSEREILCNNIGRHEMMVSSENHPLLQAGGIYTVDKVEVHPWYTLVWLKEFPGISFNSVIFREVKTMKEEKREDFG